MLKNFLKHFPPPRFLDVPYTGLVFSDSSIRTLVLDKKNKHPVNFAEVALEAGTIINGQVKNERALAKALSNLKEKLPSPFIRFVIPDESSYVFTSKVPVVPGKDARESVDFILEENVPLPLADITFDFMIERIEKNQAGYLARVSVIASSSALVDMFVNSLREGGLEPLSCLNESQATVNSVVPKSVGGTSVIVQVHSRSAGVYIARGNFVEFSSVVVISPQSQGGESIAAIKSEVERAVEYWNDRLQKPDNLPKDIHCYLCGEEKMANMVGQEIAKIDGLKPGLANVWANVFSLEEYIPDTNFSDSLRLAPAVGLFLENS